MQISSVDSYFSWIKQQLVILSAKVSINGSLIDQPVGSVVAARDWPQTAPIEGGLYLLVLNSVPTGGSQAQMEYTTYVQWAWLLIGINILPNQQAQNRGDRHRSNFQIMENLRQAHYPGYCFKKDYSCNSQGSITTTDSASVYPYSISEMVRFTPLEFKPNSDNQKSGLVYGAAATEIKAYDDISVLVA